MAAPSRPTARQYPALARFLDGYLHQDFRAEHRTARAAVTAFIRDATDAEVRRVALEFDRSMAAIADWPWDERRDALSRVGGAWRPATVAELAAIQAVLRRAADHD
ncbi:MAG: contact-dependent growth inhibition system immunity protein [Tepidiformaceae bacterium]